MADAFITQEYQARLAAMNGGEPSIQSIPGKPQRVPKMVQSSIPGQGSYQDGWDEVPGDPSYKIVYPNGKSLTVVGDRDPSGNATGAWLGDGDALTTPKVVNPKITRPTRLDKPVDIKAKIAEARRNGASEEDIADAFASWDLDTGNLVSGAPGGTIGGGGGSGRAPTDPSLIAQRNAAELNSLSQIAEREATQPGEIARTASQTALANQQIEDLKRKGLPAQQKLLEEAQSTINYIKSQIAAGTITTAQADQYYGQVNDYVKTGLQATTPFELWQEQKKQETERAKMGQDLLTQRISSGSSLAANMYGNYTSTLTANGGLLVNPGPYNPVEHAKQTVTDLGGGEGTFDMAKALMAPLMSGVGSPTGIGGAMSPAIQAILNGGGAAAADTGAVLDSGIVESNGQQSDGEVTFTPEQEAWFAEHGAAV